MTTAIPVFLGIAFVAWIWEATRSWRVEGPRHRLPPGLPDSL